MSMLDPVAWSALAEQPVLEIGATVFVFLAATHLHRRSGGYPLLNPTLVSILIIAVGLKLAGISYDTYLRGAGFIHFLLGPAVVLLAVPLFRQTALIRASGPLLAAALAVGLPVGIVSAVGIAWVLGARMETLLSLAPKSVTTGIAIGISEKIGGVPALTAVLVIMTGIVGAVFGPVVTRMAGIRDPRAVGLAMGIASHGIGTARALQMSEVAGAFSSLGMGLNGVLTAVLVPLAFTFL
jgi:predicted murein hydrolase (TIGR00659 family)